MGTPWLTLSVYLKAMLLSKTCTKVPGGGEGVRGM